MVCLSYSSFCLGLRCVRCLFLSLFRFVLRLSGGLLRFHVVKLTAWYISFPTRFLYSGSRLFPLSIATFRDAGGVLRVVTGTLFFFICVRFFSVVGRFLFRAILIVVCTRHLFRYIHSTFFRLFCPFFLVEDSLFRRRQSVHGLFTRLLFRYNAFLFTRVCRVVGHFGRHNIRCFPFLFQWFLSFHFHRRIQRARRHLGPVHESEGTSIFQSDLGLFMVSFRRYLISEYYALNTLFFLSPRTRVCFSTLRGLKGLIASFCFFFAVDQNSTDKWVRYLTIRQLSFCICFLF